MALAITLIELLKTKMPECQLFGTFHLFYLVIGFSVCLGLAACLRHLSKPNHRRLLLAVWLFLLVSELFKQWFWAYLITYRSYDWILFPFHLCSMPMYLLPFLIWGKNQKRNAAVEIFLMSFSFLGGLLSVLLDGGLLREYYALTITYLNWHLTLVFLGFYLGLRRKPQTEGFLSGVRVFAILCGIAFFLNVLLYDFSNRQIDMFFVGPAPMTLLVFMDIAEVAGRLITTVFYLILITFGAFLSYLLCGFILPKYLFISRKQSQIDS
ncbi:MAG: YwaF family protein [Erysipelotrichaceae bacterium]|jgi:hypothetical protein|nr:YwaF family protein [Erysipelotrichaceae bacterium]